MKHEYQEITHDLLCQVENNAWSIECMEAHDAAGRETEYIGSKTDGHIVYDYYIDEKGSYWFRNRALLDGNIVSMERYIFGHEITKKVTK